MIDCCLTYHQILSSLCFRLPFFAAFGVVFKSEPNSIPTGDVSFLPSSASDRRCSRPKAAYSNLTHPQTPASGVGFMWKVIPPVGSQILRTAVIPKFSIFNFQFTRLPLRHSRLERESRIIEAQDRLGNHTLPPSPMKSLS